MKQEILCNDFLEKIADRIPQKTEIANILAEMLCIGKEAVYRRLRREVPFTFQEAMIISRQLGISLDTLETNNSSNSKPFKFNLIEYVNPVDSDFALLEEMTNIIKSFKNVSDNEAGEITNILPQLLYIEHKDIFKFFLFKWKYQSNKLDKPTPYREIIVKDKLQQTQEEYAKFAKRLNIDYVLDRQLFQYLVTNIKYFYDVNLVSGEEVQLIKQDLFNILDEIDNLSTSGVFKETGKRVNLYISNVNVDTNYVYVSTPDYQLTIIKAFLLNGIASTDRKTFEEVKLWMKSMKQQSILITKSGEKNKINFLEEQYNIINSLSQI